MELRHLRFFLEVVQRGGFSAAAKALGSTQPTVSKAILQLEHDCGEMLLNRLPQGVKPTNAGQVVLRRAAAMLAEEESLRAELGTLRGLETGRLSLGVSPLGNAAIFAPLIAAFRQRHPGIRIELREEGSHRLEAAVQSGEIEIGTSLSPVKDDFAWQAVCDEPLVALLPAGHVLARRDHLKLVDLAESPFIFFERGFALNSLITAACRRRGIELVEAARSGQPDFILALVEAGLGVAVFPQLMVTARERPAVRAVVLDEKDLRWRLGLIWRKSAPLSPAAQHWLKLVRETAPSS
ncbi:MAG TPA: LysR family transcriptional regulator, partial [Chthoniobacterales bacterium]